MRSATLLVATLALAACSAEQTVFDSEAQSQEAMAEVDFIGVDELAQMVAAGEVILVDVRTPEEFAEGHLPGAVNQPVETFDPAAVPLDPERETVLYCRSGNRSGRAATMLADHLQGTVRHLDGGIVAWAEAEQPVDTE